MSLERFVLQPPSLPVLCNVDSLGLSWNKLDQLCNICGTGGVYYNEAAHSPKETDLSTLAHSLPANSNQITIKVRRPAVLLLTTEKGRHES